MPDPQPKHVFISYVRENQDQVDRLCESLKKSGVIVWLDRYDITPGILWEDAIRQAIRDGAFFIACFSKEYSEKTTTHMGEELNLAIEVLRKRPRGQAWFIPVVLPGGGPDDVPDWEVFPGKTLRSIQWVPLYEDWAAGIQRILSLIKPTPPKIQNLISALRSENSSIRQRAAEALGKIGPEAKAAVPGLIEALKDEAVRWKAGEALGKIGPGAKAAVPALIEALKDEKEYIRREVVEALGKIGPGAKAAVPALIKALKDEKEYIRKEVVEALGKIGPAAKAAVPALIKALKEEDKFVRLRAAEALGGIGPESREVVPALIEALRDEDRDVCVLAMMALAEIGPEAVLDLIESLKGKDEWGRFWATEALQKINTPEVRKALKDYKKKSLILL